MKSLWLLALLLLATIAPAQQPAVPDPVPPQKETNEPPLPVVNENVCPFEGCVFREWKVEKDSVVYSTWHDDRREIGKLKPGERVQGLTGVYITRQPDRFEITKPVAELSLKPGDAILQYVEYGEGVSDVWMGGQWHKDFDWPFLTHDNVKQIQKGEKEWWVQIERADGLDGWVLEDNNFSNMDRFGGPEDEGAAAASDTKPEDTPPPPSEPELPVINEDACPGQGRIVPRWKITRAASVFSSWQQDGVPVGDLEPDQQVNVVGGVEVITEPDRLLVTKEIAEMSLHPDDVVLRYMEYRSAQADIWTKGTWHKQYRLDTVEKDDSGCHENCNSVVIKNGIKEWWVQIRNSTGGNGWVLAYRLNHDEIWDDGNFDNLCAK